MTRHLRKAFAAALAVVAFSGSAVAQQSLKLPPLAATEAPMPNIGDKLEDGSIYAGTSGITKKSLCVRANDEQIEKAWPNKDKGVMSFRQTGEALNSLPADPDNRIVWRHPHTYEAKQIWKHRNTGAFKDTFQTVIEPVYITRDRSAEADLRTEEEKAARQQPAYLDEQYVVNFANGHHASFPTNYGFRVRAVRSPCATLKPATPEKK